MYSWEVTGLGIQSCSDSRARDLKHCRQCLYAHLCVPSALVLKGKGCLQGSLSCVPPQESSHGPWQPFSASPMLYGARAPELSGVHQCPHVLCRRHTIQPGVLQDGGFLASILHQVAPGCAWEEKFNFEIPENQVLFLLPPFLCQT